ARLLPLARMARTICDPLSIACMATPAAAASREMRGPRALFVLVGAGPLAACIVLRATFSQLTTAFSSNRDSGNHSRSHDDYTPYGQPGGGGGIGSSRAVARVTAANHCRALTAYS